MEEEVVARIVDNNGEVTDEFREGDSYEKHTKEEKERKRKRDEEYRNCPKFLPDERFVKFYNNEELLFSIAETNSSDVTESKSSIMISIILSPFFNITYYNI